MENYFESFKQNNLWARQFALDFYQYGKEEKPDLDSLIKSYSTQYNEVKLLQQEAGDYISGNKYNQFKSFL